MENLSSEVRPCGSNLGLPLTSYIHLGNFLNLSELWLPQVQNGIIVMPTSRVLMWKGWSVSGIELLLFQEEGRQPGWFWPPVRLWAIRNRDSTRADGGTRVHMTPDSYLAGGKTDPKAMETFHRCMRTKTILLGRVLVIAQYPIY